MEFDKLKNEYDEPLTSNLSGFENTLHVDLKVALNEPMSSNDIEQFVESEMKLQGIKNVEMNLSGLDLQARFILPNHMSPDKVISIITRAIYKRSLHLKANTFLTGNVSIGNFHGYPSL